MRVSSEAGEVIETRLLSRWGALLGRAPWQVGGFDETDAELVPLGDGRLLALTVDTVDEEIRLGLYRDPLTAGRVAAVAALSDLAAVGADPVGLLLSVGLPAADRERVQERVARGVREVCEATSTFVLGGDTNETAALSVTGMAAGLVPRDSVLTRVGARPGHLVGVTAGLGSGAAFAASVLLAGAQPDDEDGWHPAPRLREGRLLRGLASACMDTSDGLVATLDQVARLNRVRVHVTESLDHLLEPGAAALARRLRLPPFALLAAPHGEYELVFCVAPERWRELVAAGARAGWSPRAIGRVEAGEGLLFGGRPVDGARVRNALVEAGGDPRGCARALCGMLP